MSNLTKTLIKDLQDNVVMISFRKKNGELRRMMASNRAQDLPAIEGIDSNTNQDGAKNRDVVITWDLDLGAWRSFRLDSVLSVTVLRLLPCESGVSEIIDDGTAWRAGERIEK